jgi:hypothetical protein
MLKLGAQEWEIIRQDECSYCRSLEELRDRFDARRWLQQFKGDALSMNALRRMLSRERSAAWTLDRATDDEVIQLAAEFLGFGGWHAHELLRDRGLAGMQNPGSSSAGAKEAQTAASAAQAAVKSSKAALLSESRTRQPPQSTTASTEPKLTWIEIELVNPEGKPVPGVEYEIKFEDGTVQKGTLDSKGRARHEQIKPGKCQVTFPKVDAGDWSRA